MSFVGIVFIPHSLSGLPLTIGEWNLFGVMVIGLLFVARHHKLTDEMTSKKARFGRYLGCPKWMRRAGYVFMVAGVILFFLPAFLELFDMSDRTDGTNMPSTLPGGFGLICFSSFFAQLYSLLKIAEVSAKNNEAAHKQGTICPAQQCERVQPATSGHPSKLDLK